MSICSNFLSAGRFRYGCIVSKAFTKEEEKWNSHFSILKPGVSIQFQLRLIPLCLKDLHSFRCLTTFYYLLNLLDRALPCVRFLVKIINCFVKWRIKCFMQTKFRRFLPTHIFLVASKKIGKYTSIKWKHLTLRQY